jgi:hypothetical protein
VAILTPIRPCCDKPDPSVDRGGLGSEPSRIPGLGRLGAICRALCAQPTIVPRHRNFSLRLAHCACARTACGPSGQPYGSFPPHPRFHSILDAVDSDHGVYAMPCSLPSAQSV